MVKDQSELSEGTKIWSNTAVVKQFETLSLIIFGLKYFLNVKQTIYGI
jgi:hypothetical protein